MSKKKFKASRPDAKEDPKYTRGLGLIEGRLVRAREVYTKGGEDLLRTFNDHVHPVVNEGIKSGLIDPKVLGDKKLVDEEEYVENLTILDVLLWHVFKNSYIVPRECLRDPNTDKYEHAYIASFEEAHAIFMLLRELDNQPGYDGHSYLQALFPNEGQKKPNVAMLARLIDFGSLAEEGLFAYVSSEGLGVSINIPSDEEWDRTKYNLAQSGLTLWASLADRLGLSSLVRKIKDFAVKKVFPGIWEYATYEMSRLQSQIEQSNKIMVEIKEEVEKELKKNGIIAEVKLREEGKSLGSLGLKAKKRAQEQIVEALCEELGGIPKSVVNVDISDPKKSKIFDQATIAETISAYLIATRIMVRYDASEYPGLMILKHGNRNIYVDLNKIQDSPFVFPHAEDKELDIHDLSAGRIIIKRYEGKKGKKTCKVKEDEETLIEKAYEAQRILASCISLVLRRRGVTTFSSKITDYVAEPKESGYKAIHTDTEAKGIISFEWQLMTQRMYIDAEEGGAAHSLYKMEEVLGKEVLIGVKEIILNARKGSDPVNIREGKQVTFTVKIGKKDTNVQLPEGRLIIDALVDAGVELAKVASLEVKGKRERILHLPLKEPMTVDVTYSIKPEEQIIKGRLAKQMLEICHGQVTRNQLREIISGKRK